MEASVNASTLPVADEPVLVGREPELARFDRLLEDRQPLLVVVTGMAGVGKSSLLHAFRGRAEAAGWKTAPAGPSAQTLRITPETTEEDFGKQVHAILAAPNGQTFIEKSPAQSPAGVAPEQNPLHPVVEQLRARAPMLLLIDGCQASQGFADWFQKRFVPDVKRCGAPLLVAVAERAECVTTYLSPIADRIFPLGPLQELAIRQHFTIIGRRIDPPMGESELDAYVAAAHREPEMLGSLTRVLKLALRRES